MPLKKTKENSLAPEANNGFTFKHFRIDRPKWQGLPCAEVYDALYVFIFECKTAFFPPSGKAENEYGARRNTQQADNESGTLEQRQTELEEAASLVIEMIAAPMIAKYGHVIGCYAMTDQENIIPHEFMLCNKLSDLIFDKQFKGSTFELPTLSTGRTLSIDNLYAAAALVQLDRAMQAYLDKDMTAFAHLVGDLPWATNEIRASHSALDRQREYRRRAKQAKAKTAKGKAMAEIEREFEKMNRQETPHRSDAAFAQEMIRRFPILVNETSIKNAIARWRGRSKSLT
jgi:hypothetical protein